MNYEPLNFAFIMATGIVSIVLKMLGHPFLSLIFFTIGIFFYLLFVIRFFLTLWKNPKEIQEQLSNGAVLFKYLTFSAGTNSLAARFALSSQNEISFGLGIIGTLSTILFIYAIFTLLFFQRKAYPIADISPLWLLITIATNSVGIVISTLWNNGFLENPLFILLALGFWTFGAFHYLFFMTLNLYRMFFSPFTASDLNPAYWTCMGAAAIAVVDGCLLISLKSLPPFIISIIPFVQGMVILFWCFGTAWIPLLCIMGFYRHVQAKIPLHYTPSLWAISFPLGMYAAATHLLVSEVNLHEIQATVPYLLWIAVIVWLLIVFKRLQFYFNSF